MTRRLVVTTVSAVLAGCLMAGCGTTISVATSLRNWAAVNHFGQSVWDLVHDAKNIRVAIMGNEAPIAVRTDCLELFQDANGENTDLLPTPDDQLTQLLSSAYDVDVHAAALCDEHSTSRVVLAQVLADLDRGFGKLVEGALREEAVTGRPLHVKGIP
jgi:hypothetical protein